VTNACWGRRAAWILLLGLACTRAGTSETAESSGGSGPGTSGTDESVTATGGVFTVTSATEGDESSAGTTGATTGTTTGTETTTTTTTMMETTAEGSSTSTGEPDLCPGLVAELTAALTAGARCQLLLQVDDMGALLGWHSVCGAIPPGDKYTSKSAIGATSCCKEGKLIGTGESPFIYHQQPVAPETGGVAIVSNHLGAVVLDAAIGLDAAGTISTPATWQDPGALGAAADCGGTFTLTAATYDLSQGGPLDPPPLDPALLESITAAIATSALPAALEQVVVVRTIILGYEAKFMAPGSTVVLLLELSQK